MYDLVMRLLLAHLLGDFVFQPDSMVEGIRRGKLKSPYLYAHVGVHLVLLLLLTGFAKQYIVPVLLLAFSHLIIDIITKILIIGRINNAANLIFDQILHFIAIALFVNHFYGFEIDFANLLSAEVYLFVIAIIVVTTASSVLMRKIMELFKYPIPNDGLHNAGKYIGIIERLFVFGFVIISFWEGIGFLLAAKSIFRFGDLKEKKDIRLTEYFLIGTLISFGIAIVAGVVYLRVREGMIG